jgi:1-acyl-sn-glycerol-3-phosphate acyltransferase
MRNQNGDELKLHPFHDGSFKVAQRGPCPIIPVAISNTANIFENHIPWIKATRVVIEYGKPVSWDDLDKDTRKHIGAHYQQIIHEMLVKNQPLTLSEKKNAA